MDEHAIAKLRHEVIDRTIVVEIMLHACIITHLGLQQTQTSSSENKQENFEKIKLFEENILQKMELWEKFQYSLAMAKQKGVLKRGFKTSCQRFCNIRNQFAHTLAPTSLSSSSEKEIQKQEHWKLLHKEHTELGKEICNFLFMNFVGSRYQRA